jgi:hypothetical protein
LSESTTFAELPLLLAISIPVSGIGT